MSELVCLAQDLVVLVLQLISKRIDQCVNIIMVGTLMLRLVGAATKSRARAATKCVTLLVRSPQILLLFRLLTVDGSSTSQLDTRSHDNR
jgi:hypothetical protein